MIAAGDRVFAAKQQSSGRAHVRANNQSHGRKEAHRPGEAAGHIGKHTSN
jgi:hypothetical protein